MPLHSTVECAELALEGLCYCEQHYTQGHKEHTALRTRHKDIRRANTLWTLESDFHEAVSELEEEGVDFDR
jgi:hypothetical protein